MIHHSQYSRECFNDYVTLKLLAKACGVSDTSMGPFTRSENILSEHGRRTLMLTTKSPRVKRWRGRGNPLESQKLSRTPIIYPSKQESRLPWRVIVLLNVEMRRGRQTCPIFGALVDVAKCTWL